MKKSEEKMAENVSEEKIIRTKNKCCGSMWGKLIIFGVIIVLVIVGYYGWSFYKGQTNSEVQAQKAEEAQILAIVSKVSNLMVLPNDEVPQVAEIKDAELASKEQPFLAGSVDGDILLIYANAGKAIVYSPSRNIIVNVGPVQLGDSTQTSQSVETSQAKDTTEEED